MLRCKNTFLNGLKVPSSLSFLKVGKSGIHQILNVKGVCAQVLGIIPHHPKIRNG